MILISVIIPVYNTEKYLEKSIESVLQQSFKNLEIILVDDGSTDHSLAICHRYAQADPRIKVIHKENGGLSSARNAGIELARGDYIAFVDSDDYLLPNMYERMLYAMEANQADILMCSYLKVNERGAYFGKESIRDWTGSGIDFLRSDGLISNYAWNKLYRKELFDGIRFPIGKCFEDLFIMHDVFLKAKRVALIPDTLYVYLQREGSISVNLTSFLRIDYIEALVNRIEVLLKVDAEETAVFYHIKQLYAAWKRFYVAGMLDDQRIAECWKNNYARFRLITKGAGVGWSLFHKYYLDLFRLNPRILRFFFENSRLAKASAAKVRKKALSIKRPKLAKRYFDGRGNLVEQVPHNTYEAEYKKYGSLLKAENPSLIIKRMEAFHEEDMVLISNHLILSDDPCVPTLILIVKNEYERIKLFYDHYRKLGIHQFVVLDNDSDDGTLEYLMEQLDTRVYQTCSGFQTQKKEGWIERILAMTGYHRWYIVVDSDELLDYIGSENHPLESMIRNVHSVGVRRICGYMLDMYSKEALFSGNCEIENILDQYRYFDKDWYYSKGSREYSKNYILGGPRLRMFGTILVLSKQAIFYFDEKTLYRDCHSLFPVVSVSKMPTLFVLRHYKFLNKDFGEYQRRIKEGCFFDGSIEYRTIMDQLHKNGPKSMYYHGSCEYVNSHSLRCLPYLEEMTW